MDGGGDVNGTNPNPSGGGGGGGSDSTGAIAGGVAAGAVGVAAVALLAIKSGRFGAGRGSASSQSSGGRGQKQQPNDPEWGAETAAIGGLIRHASSRMNLLLDDSRGKQAARIAGHGTPAQQKVGLQLRTTKAGGGGVPLASGDATVEFQQSSFAAANPMLKKHSSVSNLHA